MVEKIENKDGAISIDDKSEIRIENARAGIKLDDNINLQVTRLTSDGKVEPLGTLFLNEYGSVGFHGRTTSLNAEEHAGMGAGPHSISVTPNGFVFGHNARQLAVSFDKLVEVFT